MTISTDTKNITKIVRSILQRNEIDNLQLEIELVNAWNIYVNGREEGYTPAQVRERIAGEYNELGYSANGQVKNIMRQRFMDCMGVDFGSEDNTEWNTLLDFLVKADLKGEKIEAFALWCKNDPYNSPKKHQIAQTPLLVKQTWRGAFVKVESTNTEREQGRGFYA